MLVMLVTHIFIMKKISKQILLTMYIIMLLVIIFKLIKKDKKYT